MPPPNVLQDPAPQPNQRDLQSRLASKSGETQLLSSLQSTGEHMAGGVDDDAATQFFRDALPLSEGEQVAAPSAVVGPAIADELAKTADRLRRTDAPRAQWMLLELGAYREHLLGDTKGARQAYEQAAQCGGDAPSVHAHLRRVYGGDATRGKAIAALKQLAPTLAEPKHRADAFADAARLSERGNQWPDAERLYDEALGLAPAHPAALRGRYTVLRQRTSAGDQKANTLLAEHLGRLAQSVQGEGEDLPLAAWLLVEQALVLEHGARKPKAALDLLTAAVRIDGSPGPVRDAHHQALLRQGASADLVQGWLQEAAAESDKARAGRLALSAAMYARYRVNDGAVAERAFEQAVTWLTEAGQSPGIAIGELVSLCAERGNETGEVRWRHAALAAAQSGPETCAAHRGLMDVLARSGKLTEAVVQGLKAIALQPGDSQLAWRIDGFLAELGDHPQRVKFWRQRAQAIEAVPQRVEAWLAAAEVAEHRLGDSKQALALLRAANQVDPSAQEVFERLTRLLSPAPRPDSESDERRAHERLSLLEAALEASPEAAHRHAILSQILFLWEEELGLPERALQCAERLRKEAPSSRLALHAVQRNAAKLGRWKDAATAYLQEADLTKETALEFSLTLRAAEIELSGTRDGAAALSAATKASGLAPKNPRPHRLICQALRHLGRFGLLVEALRRWLKVTPAGNRRLPLWLELAAVQEHHQKKPADAVEVLKEAYAELPGEVFLLAETERLLRQMGEHQKLATKVSELAALASDPAARQAGFWRAAMLQEAALQKPAQALENYAQALAAVPGSHLALEGVERIHHSAGARGKLVAHYDQLLKLEGLSNNHVLRLCLNLSLVAPAARQKSLLKTFAGLDDETHTSASLWRSCDLGTPLATTHEHQDLLHLQATGFRSTLAREGALWELIKVGEELGAEEHAAVFSELLTQAPDNWAAFAGVVRTHRPTAEGALAEKERAAVVHALSQLASGEQDPKSKRFLLLQAAWLKHQGGHSAGALGLLAGDTPQPPSLAEGRFLLELGHALSDQQSRHRGHRQVAEVMQTGRDAALHWLAAAESAAEDDPKAKGEGYQQALKLWPDCHGAAKALHGLWQAEPEVLVRVFADSQARAKTEQQITYLGHGIAQAVLSQKQEPRRLSPDLGLRAVAAIVKVNAKDSLAYLQRGRLQGLLELPKESEQSFLHLLGFSTHAGHRKAARLGLIDIYCGALPNATAAIEQLEALLSAHPKEEAAWRRVGELYLAQGNVDKACDAYKSLVHLAKDGPKRVEAALQLAKVSGQVGRTEGVISALCDAIVTAPDDAGPWGELKGMFRLDQLQSANGYAAALEQLLAHADKRGKPHHPPWLLSLGSLFINTLSRPVDGVRYLEKAIGLAPKDVDVRAAYGRGLEQAGRDGEAVSTLRPLLTAEALPKLKRPLLCVQSLEAALAKLGLGEARFAAEEARAVLGDMPHDRLVSLRARRLGERAPRAHAFSPIDYARALIGKQHGRIADVLAIMAPLAAKALQFDPSQAGLQSRFRIGPRDGQPLRHLAARLGIAMGLEEFELYVIPGWKGCARAFPGDPGLVVIATEETHLSELELAFALSRALFRAQMGIAFAEDLPLPSIDAFILSAIRCADENFGRGQLDPTREANCRQMMPAMSKAMRRKQRKLVEALLPELTPDFDVALLMKKLEQVERELAYSLAGGLFPCIEYLSRYESDVDIHQEAWLGVNEKATTLFTYSVSDAAIQARKQAGTVWIR